MTLESTLPSIWMFMASTVDAPPLQIFAGLKGLFYFFVDKAVDYDWTFVLQYSFWALMLLLILKMIDACFS